MAESSVDKYKKALEAAEAIKDSAVEELKKEITSKIADLNAFGFSFKLTESGAAPARKRAPSSKEKHCPVCNIVGHDKRNHRNQVPLKKFTVKDLDERGLPHA